MQAVACEKLYVQDGKFIAHDCSMLGFESNAEIGCSVEACVLVCSTANDEYDVIDAHTS